MSTNGEGLRGMIKVIGKCLMTIKEHINVEKTKIMLVRDKK